MRNVTSDSMFFCGTAPRVTVSPDPELRLDSLNFKL